MSVDLTGHGFVDTAASNFQVSSTPISPGSKYIRCSIQNCEIKHLDRKRDLAFIAWAITEHNTVHLLTAHAPELAKQWDQQTWRLEGRNDWHSIPVTRVPVKVSDIGSSTFNIDAGRGRFELGFESPSFTLKGLEGRWCFPEPLGEGIILGSPKPTLVRVG
ncbi:hypothetical protein ARMSODRAFT_982893 [Armillaria solidipes]|uniref:Uncharacterized protein n=1 Tax=Armillaria solidipes TaxID=1076256 RepID=A0A2H3B0T6_9AGAR|nr:hypothetical protein ARMSODRAFT_982893 [Armillaria solidipes]